MFWINFLNIKISHKNCSKTGPSFTGCLPLTAAFNIDITAVYLGAAIRRENSRYFSILYRHHNLAKLNSESKTQGGNGGSWTYKVSIKIRRRSYIFWRHFSNPNKTPILHFSRHISHHIRVIHSRFSKISCTRSCLLRLWIFLFVFWKTHLQINVLVP